MTDRCSPILVREVLQALGGRAFAGTLTVAVCAVVLLALVFAWFGEQGEGQGRIAFMWCIVCMTPIVLLILPLQAFASMRQEVTGGTAEQLLLTRLRPSRIVLGKVLAGLAQFVLFLGVFAPLMALTFVLRGIDAPTIVLVLVLAVLSNIAATVFAIALGSVSGTKATQNAMQSLASAGLFTATFGVMAGAFELQRELEQLLRDRDFWLYLWSIVGCYAVGIWLFAMVATASLAHAHENRSTQFRVFAAVCVLLAGLWAWIALDPSDLDDAPGVISALLALFLAPFWIWAACEDTALSPRVRTLVPRRAGLALLSAPFLPGGGRGVAFAWILAALGVGIGLGIPWLAGQPHLGRDLARNACLMAWCYVIVIAALARFVRTRLRPGRARSWIAFVVVVFLVAILSVLPIGVEVIADGRVRGWHAGHLTNPFFTVVEGGRRGALVPLAIAAGVAIVACAWTVLAGVREVLGAARARRAHEPR